MTSGGTTAPQLATELRIWRKQRGLTQQVLAERTGISVKHLSFLENERAQPSREIVLALADALELNAMDRNRLLISAGFAPPAAESVRPEDIPDIFLRMIHETIRGLSPKPAAVVDIAGQMIAMNRMAAEMYASCADEPGVYMDGRFSVPLFVFHPSGLRSLADSWELYAQSFMQTFARGRAIDPDRSAAVLGRIQAIFRIPSDWRGMNVELPPPMLVPLTMRLQHNTLRMQVPFVILSPPYWFSEPPLESLLLITALPLDQDSQDAMAHIEAEIREIPPPAAFQPYVV